MANAIWLADVLRAAGLNVVERDGWKDRGRAAMGEVKGVLLHHTAARNKGNAPSLSLIEQGRSNPFLPGPLSHLLLARDGTFFVVAAGRCNHAGRGSWQGITDGNSHFIGIEAENDGIGEEWGDDQLNAAVVGTAAILAHIKADDVMAAGHKEYAQPRGRKIDPTFDMVEFREVLEAQMTKAPPPGIKPATVSPTRAMLRKGDRGESVRQLQRLLSIVSDGRFGPKTDAAVRAFQKHAGLAVDGKVGPKTWAALGVK